jgi:hypothetical protein
MVATAESLRRSRGHNGSRGGVNPLGPGERNHVDGSALFVKFRARLTDLESSKLVASNI